MRHLLIVLMIALPTLLLAKPVEQEQLVEHVQIPYEKYTLENGFSVILSEDKTTPAIAVNTWYNVGAVNEKPHKTGLAHLFEHLMFEGSRHVGPSQHFKMLEKIGAYDVNASTNFFNTNYYQTIPSNQLDLALGLESSRMFFLDITQGKLDEQRAVVRREREQRYETTPYGNAKLSLWQNTFPKDHPYFGKVIGSHEDLQAATLKDVQSFFDRHYGPSNACLTLVGNFDKNAIKPLIEKYYGSLPKGDLLPEVRIPKAVIDKQEIIRFAEKLGKLPLISVLYITPGLFQPGDAEMDIIAHVLTGGEYGRLTKALTREKLWASAVSAYQQSMDQMSVFVIDILLNPDSDEQEVIKELDKVIDSLENDPPSLVEQERARNAILKNQLFSLQNVGGSYGKAELLQTYNRYAHNPGFLQQDIMRYQKIDQKALQEAKQSFLGTQSRKILIAKPSTTRMAHRE